jgi:hypothetical protein
LQSILHLNACTRQCIRTAKPGTRLTVPHQSIDTPQTRIEVGSLVQKRNRLFINGQPTGSVVAMKFLPYRELFRRSA